MTGCVACLLGLVVLSHISGVGLSVQAVSSSVWAVWNWVGARGWWQRLPSVPSSSSVGKVWALLSQSIALMSPLIPSFSDLVKVGLASWALLGVSVALSNLANWMRLMQTAPVNSTKPSD